MGSPAAHTSAGADPGSGKRLISRPPLTLLLWRRPEDRDRESCADLLDAGIVDPLSAAQSDFDPLARIDARPEHANGQGNA